MSQRPLVVVTDHLAEAGEEKPVLDGIADLLLLQTGDERDVIQRGGNADILLVYHDIRLTAATINALPRCKAIIRCGVGFDNVDLHTAGQNGIVVCNVPDYGTEEVADHALMMLLASARRLVSSHLSIRQDRQWNVSVAFGSPRLRGKTLGLIGCGRIGTAMARRGLALGMRVVFFDPYLPDGIDKALGIERAWTLSDLLQQSQFLSLHCPLTAETRHILNAETLAALNGAYIVNTARGGCIDMDALLTALDRGQVAFAALDVVDGEPLTHEGIRNHPNILLTPHTAFYSVESFAEMRIKGAQEARRVIEGVPVRNPVNLHCLTNPRAIVSR